MYNRRNQSKLTLRQTALNFIYDPENKTICTRTPLNWLSIISFYVISMIFIFLCYYAFSNTLVFIIRRSPNPWTDKSELIEDANPEMSLIPTSGSKSSALFWYKKANITKKYIGPSYYQKVADKFLAKYDEAEKNPGAYSNCPEKKERGKPCMFKRADLGECAKPVYGNEDNTICIFVKLTNLYNWEPTAATEWTELPKYIPLYIESKILGGTDEEKKQIWLHCEGASAADKDHIGKITYFPMQGFPSYYFPFKNEKNYLKPLVAVQFSKIKAGNVIVVHCSIFNAHINFENFRSHQYKFALYIQE